ncbi:alpha-glucosidase [Acidobacteria bacterium AB60]|nr:alpha-glucosidase [Acidobacteria bacterium AB60]
MHWTKRIAACGLALVAGVGTLAVYGESSSHDAAQQPPAASSSNLENWWKNAVIYEIYPRSFQDTNSDGIGDLKGITAHLDYLERLGVDAIWLTPVYPSPQVDFGYDISDYEAIDPQYGTMADFDHLVAEAKKHHIRILMDMVMNHTSDKHKWFLESRSSKNNPYRDWYVWHDGKGETAKEKGEPPNNWQSDFGHSAWEWDGKTRQYYYHKFYIQQPDLNWNNPKVHEAFKDIIRFWLNKGVGGFRFDAITTLFEDPEMRDDEILKDKEGKSYLNAYGDTALNDTMTNNLPGVHPVMQEMRAVADQFNPSVFPGTRVFIGETYLPNIAELAKQYGEPGKPEFQLPMDTQIGFINKLDVETFRTRLNDAETKLDGNIPLLVFDNHDNPRLDLRYGDGVHNEAIERMIATILFASRGASLFYYGDEIGMKTTPPTRKEEVKDPVGLTGWPKDKGRDGERTPMQWSAGPNAGFTNVTPWLPVPPTYKEVNVQAEENKPESMLEWYRKLIELKKNNPALAHGENVMLDPGNMKVLSWLRKGQDGSQVVVACNFTVEPQTVNLTTGGEIKGSHAKALLTSPGGISPASLDSVTLPPFGVYVGEVQ